MGAQASKAKPNNLSEAAAPLLSPPPGQEQSPVQCEDDPVPSNRMVIDGNDEFPMTASKKGPKDHGGKSAVCVSL